MNTVLMQCLEKAESPAQIYFLEECLRGCKFFAILKYIGSNFRRWEVASKSLEDFFSVAVKAQPFIFTINKELPAFTSIEYPSLPFPICSFELSGNLEFGDATHDNGCLLVLLEETCPGTIFMSTFWHAFEENPTTGQVGHSVVAGKSIAGPEDYGFINAFLGLLSTEKVGVEKVRFKTRIGKGSERKQLVINKIIHIHPKKVAPGSPRVVGVERKIDWSHSWGVRGHWRTRSGFGYGKDRAGQYTVTGMTWVVPHTKGQGEFVKKLRVVRTGEEKEAV